MQTTLQLVLASIAVGVPLGIVFSPGAWEKRARRLPSPWLPFGRNSLLPLVLGVLLVKLPLAMAIFLAPPYFVLNYLGLIPLRDESYQVFSLCYLLSLGVGKLARYLYWRWALRGQLI